MNWLRGYGAPSPGPMPAQRESCVPVTCPQCGSDHVQVRTAARGISYLECMDCHHGDGQTMWKVAVKLKRVLIVIDAV